MTHQVTHHVTHHVIHRVTHHVTNHVIHQVTHQVTHQVSQYMTQSHDTGAPGRLRLCATASSTRLISYGIASIDVNEQLSHTWQACGVFRLVKLQIVGCTPLFWPCLTARPQNSISEIHFIFRANASLQWKWRCHQEESSDNKQKKKDGNNSGGSS